MRYLKFLVFWLAIMLPAQCAWAEKTKTAEYKAGVLTDLKYGYSLSVLDNWKVKTFKESQDKPEILRVLLNQKNYRVNQETKDLGGDFTIPEIQIYVRPDTMTGQQFAEKLKAAVLAHDASDDLISKLNLILTGEYIGMQNTELGGQPVVQALFKRPWERHLQGDPDDPRYRHFGGLIVRDVHDVHEVFALNHNGNLYEIQALAENEFYQSVREEFVAIIASLNFAGAQPVPSDTGKGE